MGRATSYNESTAGAIIEQIAEGNSLRSICLDPEMPGLQTVFDWLTKYEDFRSKYARARESQADVMDDKILQVADECTEETAQAARVKIGAYQWRASKLNPKKYGDKLGIGAAEGLDSLTVRVLPIQAEMKTITSDLEQLPS